MVKKHSITYIREIFEKEGYTLLDAFYKGYHYKLNTICPSGHNVSVSLDSFNKHKNSSFKGCKQCADEDLRLDIEYIRSIFKEKDCELLSTGYINAKQLLPYVCSEGHIHRTTFNNFILNKNSCPLKANNIRHALDFIKYNLEKEGYSLITNYYTNQKQKLTYACPKGHIHSITWTDWYNGGYRCPTCWQIKITGSGNYAWTGGDKEYCDVWKDKTYKESIKQRDNYICQNPYCYRTTDKLVIHHINYKKKDCRLINLITVCDSCNKRANSQRDWHREWYKTINKRRFSYGKKD